MKNFIFLLFIVMSTQVFAQRWNNSSRNTARYTWGNNYWEAPSNLYYFNNNTCGYTRVPFSRFPLNSCSMNSRQLYTWNGYGYNRWNASSVPHWVWAETIVRDVINTSVIIDNMSRSGGNFGWYWTY